MSQVHFSESFKNNFETVTSVANNWSLIHIWSEIKFLVKVIFKNFDHFIIDCSVDTKIWNSKALPWKTHWIFHNWILLSIMNCIKHLFISFINFSLFLENNMFISFKSCLSVVFICFSPSIELLVYFFA